MHGNSNQRCGAENRLPHLSAPRPETMTPHYERASAVLYRASAFGFGSDVARASGYLGNKFYRRVRGAHRTDSTADSSARRGRIPAPVGGASSSASTPAAVASTNNVSPHILALRLRWVLGTAASRGACGRHMPGALMRRWLLEIRGSHVRDSPRESLCPFSGRRPR
jgi:hypothetical protein